MTAQERREFNSINGKLNEFEEATVEVVAEIDQCDGSRVSLQETLDSVRETLANCYGENLQDALDEHLGIQGEVGEDDFDDISDEV